MNFSTAQNIQLLLHFFSQLSQSQARKTKIGKIISILENSIFLARKL
jgi:hypothetical protein